MFLVWPSNALTLTKNVEKLPPKSSQSPLKVMSESLPKTPLKNISKKTQKNHEQNAQNDAQVGGEELLNGGFVGHRGAFGDPRLPKTPQGSLKMHPRINFS